jgi:hypothetical protein
LIRIFVGRWAEGYKVVVGVKEQSDESAIMFAVRRAYYRVLNRIANVEVIQNFTGFGLYDRALEHFPIIPDHIRQRQSSFGIQLA